MAGLRTVLFRWRGVPIYSYSAMLYVGLIAGVAVGNAVARLEGLDPARVLAATLALIPMALAGAAGLSAVVNRRRRGPGQRGPRTAAMFGALPALFLGSVPLLRLLDLPFAAFWDVGLFTILTGMVVTRFGCLLNGCCSGRPTEGRLALRLPNHAGEWARRLPMQLLEAGAGAALLAVAFAFRASAPFDGAVFLLGAGGYGLARLILDSAREERDLLWGPLSVHQAFATALVVVSGVGFALG